MEPHKQLGITESKSRQILRKELVISYVESKKMDSSGNPISCKDCDKTFQHFQMQFDHLGDKIESLSHAARCGWSFIKIDTEIAKCDLVCVGCHRIRTHSRFVHTPKSRVWTPTGTFHTCGRCNNKYDKGFFYLSSGRIAWCFNCDHARRVQRRTQRREWVNAQKMGPCIRCNVKYDPLLMDFDHIDPNTKSFSISHGVRLNVSLEKLKLEIVKCRLLCVWCHVLVTHQINMVY